MTHFLTRLAVGVAALVVAGCGGLYRPSLHQSSSLQERGQAEVAAYVENGAIGGQGAYAFSSSLYAHLRGAFLSARHEEHRYAEAGVGAFRRMPLRHLGARRLRLEGRAGFGAGHAQTSATVPLAPSAVPATAEGSYYRLYGQLSAGLEWPVTGALRHRDDHGLELGMAARVSGVRMYRFSDADGRASRTGLYLEPALFVRRYTGAVTLEGVVGIAQPLQVPGFEHQAVYLGVGARYRFGR